MPPLSIKRLFSDRTPDALVLSAPHDRQSFEAVLKRIYFASEFIDPIEDIAKKIRPAASAPWSIPFGAYLATRAIAFFTIDFPNPPPDDQYNPTFSCWLESFIVAPDCQGQGYAKAILNQLPDLTNKTFPQIRRLNLTVNFRNQTARALYRKCGFEDTGKVYWDGPAGPQHILTKALYRPGFSSATPVAGMTTYQSRRVGCSR